VRPRWIWRTAPATPGPTSGLTNTGHQRRGYTCRDRPCCCADGFFITAGQANGSSHSSIGGGIYSSLKITNVTFSSNTANNYGSGIYNYLSNPTLANAILWGDSAPSRPEIYNSSSTKSIAYSDFQGCGSSGGWNSAYGTDGGGNIDANQLFADAARGNLRLQLTFPAIDAGNNAAVPAGITTDLDGNPRFVDIPSVPKIGSGTPPIVDIKAYETRPLWRVFLPLVLRNH